ncbi:hypothetical protein K1719_002279 [Acacia pycnantha]|nr:hypothetical protein K1719_002279 [Acacia pycnantha]
MAHSVEPSSSLSFTSSSQHLLDDSDCDYSDAEIIVEGTPVVVHRCILASRSKFFHELFKREKGPQGKEGRLKYLMSDFLPYGKVGYEAFLIFLRYVYTGKLKPSPMEVSTCVDNVCAHDACRPAINFVVELMYASSIFQMPELVLLFQRRLLNFVGKAFVEDVIPILIVAFHCQLSQLVTECIERVARSDLDYVSVDKEIPPELSERIKLLRRSAQHDVEDNASLVDPLHEKRITRIHKALDSDDVELVKLLLSESDITLDEANALHYAAAYCDPKIFSEVLNLGLTNVNLRNSRGYTVLHIAAMRKEPSIIVSLLTKGAHASELTLDGQSAVSISRRLTRPKDYHAKTEQGKETNKDRMCIDLLEREMLRNPMSGDASMSFQIMGDDLHRKLQYLENRVALAVLFFPAEAKVAMDIAEAETKGSSGNFREVDLNETPIMQNKRLLSKVEALMKTVETGQRYFPHCSEVLVKFMEDELPDLCYLEKGSQEEQRMKTTRYMELKDNVQKAFNKDKANFCHSGISPSSSSSSLNNNPVHGKARKV